MVLLDDVGDRWIYDFEEPNSKEHFFYRYVWDSSG